MNAKFAASISQVNCDTQPLLNPFVHRLELNTTYEKIKETNYGSFPDVAEFLSDFYDHSVDLRTAILTLILVPVRVGLICFFVVTGWMLATVGLFGVTEQELHEKPLEGWRKKLKNIICVLGQSSLMAGGMHFTIKGRQASRDEAPILVAAPHSTFLDAGLVYVTGFPSTIVRTESVSFHIGKLINYTQPIYVWRDDAESRQKSVKEIIKRASSQLDWPQILIFPEGTCTNRSCLISFKNGAFYPGVPIQPVCIRYPNKLDTVTWTWEGPSAALGIPVVDYSYSDCKMMTRAKEMNVPFATSLVEVRKLRKSLGLKGTEREEALVKANNYACRDCSKVTYIEFVDIMRLHSNEQLALQLFRVYDKNNTGLIDLRDYLLGVLATEEDKTTEEIVVFAFLIYDVKRNGKLTPDSFCRAVCHTLGITQEYGLQIFDQVDRKQLGFVRLEDFLTWAAKYIPHLIYSETEKPNWKNLAIYRNIDKKID
ncbi:hypothetical protein YQE_03846, partial [Dendroctonus ponderosae]